MKTYEWNDAFLKSGKLATPVRVRQRRGVGGWIATYTAIPIDMLDWIRPMLRAKGLKYTTYYIGLRPADSWMDKHYAETYGARRRWSVVSGMTRKENARYAKLLVTDPKTKKREYL